MAILVTATVVMIDTLMTVGMTKTVRDECHILVQDLIAEPHMTLYCHRATFGLTLLLAVATQFLVAADLSDPADLPSPITSSKSRDPGSLDDFGEGPVKPRPYRLMEDDPLTPVSQSTIMPFMTNVDDLDPNNPLERPGLSVGWFTQFELTAAIPHLSSRQTSESLLNTPFNVPSVPLNWTAMPKITLGYRRPEGLGDWSVSYRYLSSQGSQTLTTFGGSPGGNSSSSLQLHVLDLGYTLSDLFPTDLWLVPRQTYLTGGIRVAGMTDKTSAAGGTISSQIGSNSFVGAGPRFALESLYPVLNDRWTFFAKADATGVIGTDRQSFSHTVSGVGESASATPSTVAVPVVGVRGGFHWLPDWGQGNVKFSAGYQWERWFQVGIDANSFNELTIQGPFLQGEVGF